MTSPFGYNTLRTNDALWPHLDRLKPTCGLFIDDAGAATRFANAYPTAISIYRSFRADESVMYKYSGEMLKYVKGVAAGVSPNVWLNLLCEPALGGDYVANLKQLVSESIVCLDWAYANGRKLALPHAAWYGLNPEHFPYLLPLINKINERPAQAILTSDEYFGGMAFSGVLDARGGEAWHVDPAHWLTSPTGTYFHMGRITVLFQWLKDRGINPPRWIGTETGADDLSDVSAWLKTLKVSAGYSNIRGWKTLTDQWAAWYPQWTPQRAYVEMLKAVWQQVYSMWPNVVGLCLYTWGVQADQTWRQFDLSEATEFQSLLEQVNWKGSTMPTPIPAQPKPPADHLGTPLVGKLVTPTFINIRNAPSTSAAVTLQAVNGADVKAWPVTPAVSVNGYDWRWVETGSASGWMALVSTSWAAQVSAPIVVIPPTATFAPPTGVVPVPFVDQYNNVDGPNACGPSTLAMLVNWFDVETRATNSAGEPLTSVDANDTSKAMNRANGANTSISMLVNCAKLVYGLTLIPKSDLTPTSIQVELDAGRPVAILYLRGAVPGELSIYPFGGSHFGVIMGYGYMSDGNRYFLLLEPLMKGDNPTPLNVTSTDLINALKDDGSGNAPNQGMFIDPSSLELTTPTEPETNVLFTDAQLAFLDARYAVKA